MTTIPERTKYLVVGAGMTGLAFADWIEGEDYLVLEREQEPGGYCRTITQDGFVWDYSGHFFHFRRPDIEKYLVDRMEGQRVLKVAKQSLIRYAGAYVDFPFQKNIHQLPKDELVECLYDLYFREKSEGPASFESMLYEKFGRAISEKFLVPYNEKLYATDLGTLDADAMGRFFPHADVEDIVRNFKKADNSSYNATFTYPEGGAIQYVNALKAGVSPERLKLGVSLEKVDLRNKVATTSAGVVAFEYLISSAPLPRLLEMCGMPASPETFTSNKVLVFNLGFDKKGPKDVHWIYYPQRELSFYRVGFYDNIFGTDRLSIYVEIGMPSNATLSDSQVAEYKARVIEDLRKAEVISDHELLSSAHVVLDPAYCHITTDSIAAVDRSKSLLNARGVYSAGRYGSWTYCSIEDNIIEARALAEQLSELERAMT